VFDEYSQQPSNIFTEIIRPALSDHQGYGIWIGTPKGHNDFYRLYKGLDINKNPIPEFEKDWLTLFLPASTTGVLPREELADARKTMTEDEYLQEYECSFEAAIKGAYYAKEIGIARKEGRITTVPYERSALVHTWWDLGIGDSTAIIFAQQVGREWRWIDYYEASGEGLGHYAKVLHDKGYTYGTHYGPHDIEVRELGSGKSRKEMAQTLGLNFEVAPKLSIEDGINALRMRFNQLWIDETKCARLIDALSLYRKEWDDARGDFKTKPTHDWTSHGSDAARYWAVTEVKTGMGAVTLKPKWSGFNRRG
jgi:hypothetical protein